MDGALRLTLDVFRGVGMRREEEKMRTSILALSMALMIAAA